MQISNNTTKDRNMDKDYYKTKGVFETKGDHMDEAEDFLDAISDIGLLDLEVSNDFTYVGHAEVGLKCIKIIPKTKDLGVEKLFQIQFQVLSYEGDFVKIRTVDGIHDDDGIEEYYYYDSEGNEHPADSDNFEEFMSDLNVQ